MKMSTQSNLSHDLSDRSTRSSNKLAACHGENRIQDILNSSRIIAVVGLSTHEDKDSHLVARFLQKKGFKIIPVHPKADRILGEKAYSKLVDIPEVVDIVNVFRPSAECPEYATQAVKIGAKTLWLQLDIISREALEIATAAGLNIVLDRCIKVEYNRYHRETNS